MTRLGVADYIRNQRAIRLVTTATLTGDALAEATGSVVEAAIIAASSVSGASRLSAGLTTGVTYAASLAALGSAAGPYGTAVGAVVGFAAGLASGFTPTNRSTFADRFATLAAQLPIGIRQRLVPWCKQWGATCRQSENLPALGAWRTIDQNNVNLLGSAQIMCLWAMQHLLQLGFWDVHPTPPPALTTAFADLPRSWQYAVGLYVSNQDDSVNMQALVGGMAPAMPAGPGTLGAWINANGHLAGAPSNSDTGAMILDIATLGISGAVSTQRSGRYTAAQIRAVLSARDGGCAALPDLTYLPDDPQSIALRADPANLTTARTS